MRKASGDRWAIRFGMVTLAIGMSGYSIMRIILGRRNSLNWGSLILAALAGIIIGFLVCGMWWQVTRPKKGKSISEIRQSAS